MKFANFPSQQTSCIGTRKMSSLTTIQQFGGAGGMMDSGVMLAVTSA